MAKKVTANASNVGNSEPKTVDAEGRKIIRFSTLVGPDLPGLDLPMQHLPHQQINPLSRGKKGMSSLNHVVLIGHLTRDPEVRYTGSGTAAAHFTIAVNRRPRPDGTKEADYIRIVVWGKQGENCGNYLAKGRLVAVEGRLRVHNYQNEGQIRTYTEVVAESVQFLTPKHRGDELASDLALPPEMDAPEMDAPEMDVPEIDIPEAGAPNGLDWPGPSQL
jgi:single-strand DNA-binding protein